jgi:hypothetical protein
MAFLQFAGRHENLITSVMDGICSFGTWNATSGVYIQSTTLTINTPGTLTIGGLPLNGQSAGTFIDGVNNQTRGFAGYINGLNPVPVTNNKPLISIGALNYDSYEATNGPDWNPFLDQPGGFYAYDEVTQSSKPGNAAIDGAYTLIFLSTSYRGQSTLAQSVTRVIYKASVGTLGAVAARLVNTGGSGGGNAASNWVVSGATTDESTAGQLMANGYGVLLDGALVFASQQD